MPNEPTQKPERLSTGVAGLDRVLGGGFFHGQVYVLAGAPGSGKTILANQMAYAAASAGKRVVYATLMAESHAQILWQLSGFDFFAPELAGERIQYMNAFSQLESGGLAALRDLLRDSVRRAQASLLIIDGVVSAELLARSETDYKRFVQDLQSWCALMGCTVVLLTSAGDNDTTRPEHTMVDGLVIMQARSAGMRRVRQLRVAKLRGTAFLEGDHVYDISTVGLQVYPRLEALLRASPRSSDESHVVTSGIPGLDALLGGGIESDTITMALGTSGSGKTIAGMQFLMAGARQGERGLLFGFYEDDAALERKASRLEMPWKEDRRAGLIDVAWQPAAEQHMDLLADRLLERLAATGAKRLFIDGMVGFKEAAVEPARVGTFFHVLCNELRARQVTTFVTDETRDLLVRRAQSPTEGLSALCENILFLCQVEVRARVQRLLCVMKVRCASHARSFHEVEVGSGGLRLLGPAPSDGSLLVTQAPPEAGRP
jgi:circadian clock protein KaiC